MAIGLAETARAMSDAERFLIDDKYLTAAEYRAQASAQPMANRQIKALDLVEGDVVVDVGCYAGAFVAEAARRFPRKTIIGIDYFDDNIRLAHTLYPELRDRLRRMSVYQLEFPDASIDCVTLQEVIEHLEGAAAAVKEINRILKPGGALIVTAPNPFYWRQMLMFFLFEIRNSLSSILGRRRRMATQIYFAKVEWNRHVYAWTPDTLLTLLVVNGFEYVEHHYETGRNLMERAFLRMFPFLGGTQIMKVRKIAPAPPRLV